MNSNGSVDTNFDTQGGFRDEDVNAIVVQPDNKILVGGNFTIFHNTDRRGLTRLNENGSLDVLFNTSSGLDSGVLKVLRQPDGKIIVAGGFARFFDQPTSNILRLNPDGTLDESFDTGTGFNDAVYNLELQADGKILAGGIFTSFNGIARNGLARLNPDGSLDTSFEVGTGFNDWVYTIKVLEDGKILVGGAFTNYNGTARNRIIRLNADGSNDTNFNPGTGFNSWVIDMAIQEDGKIMLVGNFGTYNGTNRSKIVRINPNGLIDTSFNPGSGFFNTSQIYAVLIQPDGKILAGGSAESYNGTGRDRVFRINPDGTLDNTFFIGTTFGAYRGPNGTVRTLALQPDGRIIAGGDFTVHGSFTRRRITRINTNGSIDTSFNPGQGFNGTVRSLVLQPDDKIVVGGFFTAYNNIGRNRLARVFATEFTSITTANIPAGTFCPNSTINVGFTTTGNFAAGMSLPYNFPMLRVLLIPRLLSVHWN
ncbi:MAG: delta-60 repeat domain-containing protein [Microscillaceae bacterium]|nr:delta-60 repeat domain-containing protein [Microscillaceae bacterium]